MHQQIHKWLVLDICSLQSAGKQIGILILSQYVEEYYVKALLSEGTEGVGYLLKDRVADVATLVGAVQRVANREAVLDPEVVAHMMGRRRPSGPLDGLTPRELEIISAVVAGYANKEVAEHFKISEDTVKHHMSNIFDKVGVSTRLELALFAVNQSLPFKPLV